MIKKIFLLLIIGISIIPVFASDWDLPGITIISRDQRWADESLRYTSLSYQDRKSQQRESYEEEMNRLEESDFDTFFNKQKLEYEQAMRNDYLQTNYSSEQKINKVIYQEWNNHLKWPESFHNEKNKIIIHHTAGNTSDFTGKQSALNELRDIYKYHTLTRWWWDIWYHFVIDPYGNIYEGRAGGDSVIAAHTAWNNTPSIGVSLMGNFEEQKPTLEQVKSLVSLITVLAKKYDIDPMASADYHKEIDDVPYMKSKTAGAIAGHRDAGATACPWKYLYQLLPQIKKLVVQNLARGVLVSSSEVIKKIPTVKTVKKKSTNIKKWLDLLKDWQPAFDKITVAFQKAYIKKTWFKKATIPSTKITSKISIDQAKQFMYSDISVLLYDLSKNYHSWDVSCEQWCTFDIPSHMYVATKANIQVAEWWLVLQIDEKKYYTESIIVKATKNNLIEITNYPRVSYYKIPWNTFYGSLTFKKWQIKNLKTGKFDTQNIIINTLPFYQYTRGIVETNDSEHTEKIKAMNLISKGYALFYMDGKNKHPSIPENAWYTAIDSPEMFQKYVGAGVEKTLKTVPELVEEQKNQILLYNNYLPILPYFNCSAWFTRAWKDKRGWTDTPYLVSRVDIEKCSDFNGHGVGLSWRWAQFFAEKWWTYQEILEYYYPGTKIVTVQ